MSHDDTGGFSLTNPADSASSGEAGGSGRIGANSPTMTGNDLGGRSLVQALVQVVVQGVAGMRLPIGGAASGRPALRLMKRRCGSSYASVMTADIHAPKRPKFLFVHSSDLDSVKLDEDERVDGAETLMEQLQAPIADPCLTSLRKIMSMTYFESLERTSEICVREIRGMAIGVLGELGKELEALSLARVDADRSFEHDRSAKVFQYMIVPAKELRRRVRVEGRRDRPSLHELFKHFPADPAIRALREILTMTFREATTPHQFDRIMEDIRFVAAAALVPCNPILEQIEVEPVAMPTWRRFVDGVDTLDGSDEGEEADELPTLPPVLPPPKPPETTPRRGRHRWG
ncbi:MAG: hypothetical protein KIT24_12805 [Phycisphaeraceae bacterium]|nr:hypothetical protein [Phycisphaeraceae bacterium]